MEPNLINNANPSYTQDTEELLNRQSQNSPHHDAEGGEFNEGRANRQANFFLADDNQKKSIDDGVLMIIEYIMQEKMSPNIIQYQEKLMAYLKEKIEEQVRISIF